MFLKSMFKGIGINWESLNIYTESESAMLLVNS